jgi:hypothetical protein
MLDWEELAKWEVIFFTPVIQALTVLFLMILKLLEETILYTDSCLLP